LKASKDQADSLSKSMDALKCKHTDELKELLEDKEKEAARLAKEADRRETRISELDAALRQLREQAGQTGSMAEDAQAQAASLAARLAAAQQEAETLGRAVAEKEAGLAAGAAEMAQLRQDQRAELEAAAERRRAAEAEAETGRETVAALREEKVRPEFFFVYFFGRLECVGHSFAYVAHL
jgi:hypothetical protein